MDLSVYIMGQEWRLIITDLADHGDCEKSVRKIHIDKNQSVPSARETLRHELIHAIWHITDLSNRDKDDEEETIATRLGAGLSTFWEDDRNEPAIETMELWQ